MSASDCVSGNAIAVVGMACRLPGGINSPEEFWDALVSGRDLITDVPPQRWDADRIYSPESGIVGRTVSRWGGFIDDVAGFDAEFFGIAPKEAAWMDPQQRLLLEVAYEALEDAGTPLEQLAGSECGVYIGQGGSDYWTMVGGDDRRFRYLTVTGSWARSVLSGRLSFAFDLRGPTLSIDTACSSGLAAVDVAVRYLRSGGPMALVGGVNLTLIPDTSILYSAGTMLSATGRCRFGDADADGFVRSEAAGILVLKPLDAALADGDRVRAVLLGSANGSDGRDGGLLVRPSLAGQRRVIENACRDAGVDPADIDFVEAHGSGTQAGDPVELETLGTALAAGRPADRPLLVSSAKTNLGHSEAAAGIVGLLKTVLCLEHRVVPASLHLDRPSPDVAWDDLPLRIVRHPTALPDLGRPTLAGVNSFGISGNNTHVVVSCAPAVVRPGAGRESGRPELLTLSAAGPEALREAAERWAAFLERTSSSFTDVCHSTTVRRTHHLYRLATVADSAHEAAESLRDFLAGGTPEVAEGDACEPAQVAFVFPGQGSQWAGMGRALLADEAVYAEVFDECDAAIRDETGVSVRALIESGAEDWLARTEIVQPALWATQVALAALWGSWGIEPDVVIGHSMGEVAAARVAGALGVRDAAAVICRRSALASRLTGRGAMAWTELTAAEAERVVAGRDVVVAACNSPGSTLLSGDAQAVTDVVAELETRSRGARLINVDYASHCPQVDEITGDLLDALAGLSPRAGKVPIRSTLLGRTCDGAEMDARYWARNIREPVDFTGAISAQLAAADTVFVEISAHPVLTAAIRAHGGTVRAFGSLRRHDPQRPAMLRTLADLYVTGVPVDWSAAAPTGGYVPLPTYPWQHEKFWLPPAEKPQAPTRPQPVAAPHPLLGAAQPADADGARRWTGRLDLQANGYLLDHCVQDVAILPGTSYVEVMTAAAREILGPVPVVLTDVQCQRAVFLEAGDELELRVTARPDSPNWHFTVHTRLLGEDTWVQNAEAIGGRADPLPPGDSAAGLQEARSRCGDRQSGPEFYAYHAARGNQWNGAFQSAVEVWRGRGEAVARVRLPDPTLDNLADLFHPALLDGCAQAIIAARPDVAAGADAAFVMRGIGAYRLYRLPGKEVWSHARLRSGQETDFGAADFRVYDADGLVAEVGQMRIHYLTGRAPAAAEHPSAVTRDDGGAMTEFAEDRVEWLYLQDWVGARRGGHPCANGQRWLVFQDSGPIGRSVVTALRARGDEVVTVTVAAVHQRVDRHRFQADPARADDVAEVVSTVCADGRVTGVVYLWALDATRSAEPTGRELERAVNLGCGGLAHLVRALDRAVPAEPPRLWLITRDCQQVVDGDGVTGLCQAPLWGLGPALAGERPSLRTTLVDLDEQAAAGSLVAELLATDDEDRIALRGEDRFVARLHRQRLLPSSPQRLTCTRGLTGLAFTAAEPGTPGPGQVLIRAEYAGLNFRDVLCATGAYPGEDGSMDLGWECAGTVVAVGSGADLAVGDRVAALAEGSLATHVLASAELVVRLPAGLDPVHAATMPIAFTTAYQALHVLGRVRPGERVLIHSATGGVGLAAIQVARWRGARVYGTCSAGKRQVLAELGLDGIADSRSLEFAEQFRAVTGGEGFDVIVNTLAGDAVAANLALLAPGGRYIELAKRGIVDGTTISMDAFAGNRSFHALDIVDLIRNAPHALGPVLRAVYAGYESGDVRPLRFRESGPDEVGDAFRLMARAQHVGKLVVALPQGATAPVEKEVSGTHLVTGGLGGIGSSLARHLVKGGVRDLLLLGRSPLPSDPEAPGPRLLRELRDLGAQAVYEAVDVADADAVTRLLAARRAACAPPVSAVYHLAGVFDQCVVADLEPARLAATVRPKFDGGLALHHAVAGEPVRRFVLFSSGSSVLSSPTGGAYAAGNAFLDALARHRRARGLPATLLNWGYWSEVGMVAREQNAGRDMTPRGMATFTPEDAWQVLDTLLDHGVAESVVLRVDWPAWSSTYPTAARAPLLRDLAVPANAVPLPREPELVPAQAPPAPAPTTTPQVTQYAGHDVRDTVEDALVTQVATVLGLRPDRVRRNRRLSEIGIDSLMATELRNLIEHEFGVSVRIVDILRGGTVRALAQRIRELSENRTEVRQ